LGEEAARSAKAGEAETVMTIDAGFINEETAGLEAVLENKGDVENFICSIFGYQFVDLRFAQLALNT